MKSCYFPAIMLLFVFAGFNGNPKKKILFFGDSITAAGTSSIGFITKIDSILRTLDRNEKHELIGAGVSGDKVYDLYLRMENDVLARHPDVVVIWIGVNDVWHNEQGTGTSENTFIEFYTAVVTKLKNKGIAVYMCTPLAIGEKKDMSNNLDGRLNNFSELIRQLAVKENCPLIDLRSKFLDFIKNNNPGNKESGVLTTDGVHLNNAGNLFVAQHMYKVLSEYVTGNR